MNNKFTTRSMYGFLQSAQLRRIIRFATLLFFVCIISSYAYSAVTYNTNQTVYINKQNVWLHEIMNEIEAQTEFLFIYKNEINTTRKVSVKAENTELTNVLNEIFEDTDISYHIEKSHIILSLKPQPAPTQNQQRNAVKGRVVDVSGETIIGANVYEKNTTNGVITGIDGDFQLDLPPNAVIVVSYIGYLTQEINIGNNRNFEIILQEDTKTLEEVVVVGYGTQKKADLTGAIATVGGEVLENRPITSVGAGLQGTIPGLYINFSDGTPGGSGSFNVRGTTNFNGSQALILVDGIEMDPGILNPNDIKDVTVLKDAASAAIYGARAAFGVVLITTKTGFIDRKPQVEFSANYAINTPTVKPNYMNSLEYTQWMNDANTTTNGSPYFDDITMQHVRNYFNDPVNNLPVFNHPDDGSSVWRYCGNTDWYKELTKNTHPIQQYNVSVRGGSKDAMYYASAGYYNQKGVSKWANENYDRYNILQNVNYRVSQWLEMGLNTNVSITDQKTGGQNRNGSSALSAIVAGDSRPMMPVYHPDGNFSGKSGDGSFTNIAAWQSLGGNAYYRKHNIMAMGFIKIKPLAGLTIDGKYTYKYFNNSFKNFRREYQEYDAAGNSTPFTWTSPNSVSYNKQDYQQNVLDLYATYEKKFAGAHNFKIMVGFNQESYLFREVALGRSNLISNDIPYLSLATGDRTVSDGQGEWRTRGVFSRINYDYKEKYLLALTARYDGSSRFPKEDRFAFFPSFSAGWRMSKEKFWEPLQHIVNDFKIRGSYGSLGNQVVSGYYPYISAYSTGEANYIFNGSKEMTAYAPALVSDNLTWETVTSWDVGFDMAMLGNRFIVNFDYYQRDTKDMLTKSKTLPAILGVSEPQANAADLRTTGWELTLDWKQGLSNGIKYQVTAFLTDYKAWITRYDNPTKSLSDDYYEGKRLGEIWGFVTDGFFKTDAEALAWDQSAVLGYTSLAGDIKFKDLNGDGKIDRGSSTVDDPGDRKVIGNSTPRYNFSLRGFGEWKGFDLTMFFQGTLKRDIAANNTFYLSHYESQWSVPQKMNYDYWREDNTDAFFPRARFNGSAVTQTQTHFLQNGAYIRMKQLGVGYTLPFKYVSKAKLTKIRVYFDANNLWEYSKMKDGFDPELATVNLYPFMRSYSFGANIVF